MLRHLALGALGCAGLLATAAWPPLPRLVWNATDSVPRGLYRIEVGAPVSAGEIVAARLPRAVRAMADTRRILPAGALLVKPVAAIAGADICATRDRISVDGRIVARRAVADRQGRPLPRWQGCRRLRGGQVLLLSPHPHSFDGRYFGPSEGAELIGRAVLLWRS
ncbi:S26 family signal peptidase [Sphingomonas sp. C8-2]|nr:S26 family signal peptidase [Sphingomonas sp. C8-2]